MTFTFPTPTVLRAALLAFALVVAGGLALPHTARAEGEASTADDSVVTFVAAPSDGGILRPDAPLELTVTARNTTTTMLPAGTVTAVAATDALRDAAAVRAWLGGDAASDLRGPVELGTAAFPAVAVGGAQTASLPVSTEALAGLSSGVYPVRADYSSAEGTRTSRTVIVVPGEPGTGPLGVVVPITVAPRSGDILTADELTELTNPGGQLRVELDAVTGTEAILAIDPAIVASIRVLGTSAPDGAAQWLADLLALPNTRFALQFGDADLATQVTAGITTPLAPLSLDSYMSQDDFPDPTPTVTPSPTGTADETPTPTETGSPTDAPDVPTLPTLAELTAVGAVPDAVYWPATGTAGDAVIQALGDLSTAELPSITLVDSGMVGTTAAWALSGATRLLVYDADASAALARAAESDDRVVRDGSLAAASAFAALDVADSPDAPLLVTIDRPADVVSLRTTVLAASSLGGRSATGLASLTAGEAIAVTPSAPIDDEARAKILEGLLEDEKSITAFATILEDPLLLTSPERAAILNLLAVGWRADEVGYRDTIAEHHEQTSTTLTSVAITPPSDITFAATSAPLSFSVRNDLPWPVSLILIATPNDARLVVQNTTPVDAGPSQSSRVKVPVEARVASGESTLSLQLRSPTMVKIGGQVPVHIDVRAEWESVGLIVMVSLVVAMIGLGVIRTVLRVRRRAGMPRG